MIIELRNDNDVSNYLYGLWEQGHGDVYTIRMEAEGASVTMVAVHMGVKEMGMQTGHRAHTIGLQVGNESRYAHNHCRAIKEALACNKMEIDGKERGLEPSGPRSTS